MNSTIKHQLEHRTIRFFEQKPVPEEMIELFIQVIQRTATSNGLQFSSFIRITDHNLKQKIAEIAKQSYIADVPELFIFLADGYRNTQILKESGDNRKFNSMDVLLQGITDASLSAQNLTNAVESVGMGAVFLGAILNDAQALVDLLALPKLTMPVLGVAFGYINDDPQLKPRMPMKYRFYENTYRTFDDYHQELADYDQVMKTYYDTRNRNQCLAAFTDQVVLKATPVAGRENIASVMKKQGFLLD